MIRKLLLIVGALVVVAAGAGALAHSQGVALPLLGAKPLETVIDAPLATGDSLELARFAHERCRLLSGTPRRECYEAIFLETVQRNEVRLAMDALSVLGRLDPGTVRRGHDFAHVVGINAWTPGEDVGVVYETCTGLYQSGCYHGVVQAYLDANGTDSTTVASVCTKIQAVNSSMWLRFQCVHGIGHGLVNANSLHLRRALEGCDWLGSAWDANSCYGGAFMEFIVAGRGQSHHPAKTAAAGAQPDHGAHGDHHAGHGGGPPADSFPIRDKEDPLYPCSVLDTRYQQSCYGMQAGIIIENTGADFGKIAAACDEAPVAMRPACYQGIGTYVSGFTVRNADKAIDHCSKGNPEYAAWCYVGVVKNFIDVTSLPEDGTEFCRLLGERKLAVACHNAVGEQIAVLFRSPDDRATQCARTPRDYVDVCRYGAALGGTRPPELTPFMPAT